MKTSADYIVHITDEPEVFVSNWGEGMGRIAAWAADHNCSMEPKHEGKDYRVWWLRSGTDLVATASLERRYRDE